MKHDRLGHAYLFCGTRGTGKTSVAKILAKAVNCENPVDGSPCGECASCKRIATGSDVNVIEIDAASNNGVDNVRQIREGVQYPPANAKKTVYIIDEVHMLSMPAFNALLKTLEEPPSYVLFILATTELHKVPVTIKSRCQRYDFRRIDHTTIADRMQYILDAEGTKATREALEYIARAADGSMRDALSLLDQCVSYYLGEELTLDMALRATGAVNTDIFFSLEQGIVDDDTVKVMNLVSDVVWSGTELTRFTEDFCMFLRNVLFLKLSPEIQKTLDLPKETILSMRSLGEVIEEEMLLREINVLRDVQQELRLSSLKRITLEMGILRLMRPEMDKDLVGVLNRLNRLESRADGADEELGNIRKELEDQEGEIENLKENGVTIQSVSADNNGDTGASFEREEEDRITKLSPEEQEKEYTGRLLQYYPSDVAEKIKEVAGNWNSIVSKFTGITRRALSGARAYPEENQDGQVVGILIIAKRIDSIPQNDLFDREGEDLVSAEIMRISGLSVKCRIVFEGDEGAKGAKRGLSFTNVNFPIELK
jgi:DNA polymerase-3 subunit gamma/tau